MSTFAAARSVFRSSARTAASRLAFTPKPAAAPSAFRFSSPSKSISHPIFRRPVMLSSAVETMMPYHTATASAVMTSMLSISRRSYGWLPEGRVKTR